MRVYALAPDLISASRIQDAVERLGDEFARLTTIQDLPDPGGIDLLLVDWGMREAGWGFQLSARAIRDPQVQILLFGPHADKDAHAAAAIHHLGPVMARSSFFQRLDYLLSRARGAKSKAVLPGGNEKPSGDLPVRVR